MAKTRPVGRGQKRNTDSSTPRSRTDRDKGNTKEERGGRQKGGRLKKRNQIDPTLLIGGGIACVVLIVVFIAMNSSYEAPKDKPKADPKPVYQKQYQIIKDGKPVTVSEAEFREMERKNEEIKKKNEEKEKAKKDAKKKKRTTKTAQDSDDEVGDSNAELLKEFDVDAAGRAPSTSGSSTSTPSNETGIQYGHDPNKKYVPSWQRDNSNKPIR